MKKRNRKFIVNPFVSEAQRRACYAADDPDWDCSEWSAATPKGEKLPERVTKAENVRVVNVVSKSRRALKLKLSRKSGGRAPSGPTPNQVDPSRTATLRRQMVQRLRIAFGRIAGEVVRFVGHGDAFGLADRAVQNLSLPDRIERAASRTHTEPTPAQVEAGNYRKGKVTIRGIPVTIENPAGSERVKHNPDGSERWRREMAHHYGYVNRTTGVDGDHVDVFIGPNPESDRVFVVHQIKPDGTFDEHKCMLGFLSQEAAVDAYHANYPADWEGFGDVEEMSVEDFKRWLGLTEKYSVEDLRRDSREMVYRDFPELREYHELSEVANIFCATGAGGKVDPTCSRSEAYERRAEPKGPNPALPDAARPELSKEVALGVRQYTGGGYRSLNRSLNSGEQLTDKFDAQLDKNLQAAFLKAKPFGTPVSVTRGMQLTSSQMESFTRKIEEAVKTGGSIKLHGYTSTTTHPADESGKCYFGGNVTLEIGAKFGIDTRPISNVHQENELLLDKGSTFKVLSAGKRKDGGLIVHLEQENQRAAAAEPIGKRGWLRRLLGNRNIGSRFVHDGLDGVEFDSDGLTANEVTGVEPVRQRKPWSCGAAAAMSVGRKYGVGPRTQVGWEELLGTDAEDGTDSQRIAAAFRELGLRVAAMSNMHYEDLVRLAARGVPVLCPVQDWGGGHWVVVVDADDEHVTVVDPSKDAEDGSIEADGIKVVDVADWLEAWHDEDANGNALVRYGIAVGPGATLNYDGQPRDVQGRFGEGSHIVDRFKAAGAAVGHAEHVAKEWIADKCDRSVSKLPVPVQKAVMASYSAVRVGIGVAFSAWTASQALAERVSVERGSTPEEARRLRGVLSSLDIAAFKPVAVATAGSAGLAAASWVVPPCTGAYLAYSTARNPLATARAAYGLVRESLGRARSGAAGFWEKMHGAGPIVTSNSEADRVDCLADALQQHGHDDWWIALFSAAADECGDARDAVALANDLCRRMPEEPGTTTNALEHAGVPDPRKVEAFQEFLRQKFARHLTGKAQEQVWEEYARQGYLKGAGRAFDDVNAAGKAMSAGNQAKLDFYAGGKDQFLHSNFANPVAVEKVKLMAGRAFDDLENVAADMATKMSRVLTDGLVEGKSPHDVARDMVNEIDISRPRAETIARTELIRVHAEGQLTALERLGVKGVGVAVEWEVTKDEKLCPLCSDLDGAVLSIDEARGMLPRHPNCRCCWLPANVGEDDEDQTRSKSDIEDAFGDAEIDISPNRPQSIFNRWEPVQNSFCATGEGGGIDPSCSIHDPAKGEDPGEMYEEPSPTLRKGETKLPWKMAFPESEEEAGYGKGRGAAFEEAHSRWVAAGRPGLGKMMNIPLGKDDIVVGQRGVRKRIVQAKIDGDLPMSPIEGYKFQGKYWIDNGHHTLLAAKLSGKKHVRAEINDLDAPIQNSFCPTGVGGGVDATCSPHGVHQTHVETDEEHRRGLTPAPCCPSVLTPDAHNARVGVSAMSVPPPPKNGIPRLPNLTPEQRAVESRFADAYIKNPDKFVEKYRQKLAEGKVGVAPNVYATDDVKMLNRDWNPAKAKAGEELPKESKDAMAKYNTAVHQTANAIAKRAFVEHLDEMEKLPDGHPLKSVLVTNGGCAAGKGSTLSHAAEPDSPYNKVTPAAHQVGAVWDAAGEQNATENDWIHRECSKRGIKATFAYVWANPEDGWDSSDRGVIRRAVRKGRMVDAALFADSYAEGAKNMASFVDRHKSDGTSFIFIDNRKKGEPKLLDKFPEETLKWDGKKIRRDAVKNLKSHRDDLPKNLVQAGLAGEVIWGPSGG